MLKEMNRFCLDVISEASNKIKLASELDSMVYDVFHKRKFEVVEKYNLIVIEAPYTKALRGEVKGVDIENGWHLKGKHPMFGTVIIYMKEKES